MKINSKAKNQLGNFKKSIHRQVLPRATWGWVDPFPKTGKVKNIFPLLPPFKEGGVVNKIIARNA